MYIHQNVEYRKGSLSSVTHHSLYCQKLQLRAVILHLNTTPSIETHLAVVSGIPTKTFLPKCVNEKSSTERCS